MLLLLSVYSMVGQQMILVLPDIASEDIDNSEKFRIYNIISINTDVFN